MDETAIRDAIADLLVEHFEIPRDKITGGATFRRHLGLDSLDVVDFVWFLHDRFGYQAELADYRDLADLDALVAFVKARSGV